MKVALVTGASGSIGKETVKALIRNGYFTVGQYNGNVTAIENLKSETDKEGYGGYFLPVKADFNSPLDVRLLYEKAEENFGHVDVLVNNAGVDLYKLASETTEEEWDKVFNVNVKSAFILTKLSLKKMIERKQGKIIFVSSIWGEKGASMESAYSASKSALLGYAKSLAKEVGPCGITVNCVSPGVIDTPMNERFNAEEMESLIEDTPLKRLGKSEEVANLICFLASEKADFITGQNVTIDGGFAL